MSTQVILVGWDRAVSGLEQQAAQLFQEYLPYLGGLQQDGAIDSFEVVLLGLHGGDLNGFFLIRGDRDQLNELQASDEHMAYLMRAGIYLDGVGEIRGVTGEGVMDWMNRWTQLLSS